MGWSQVTKPREATQLLWGSNTIQHSMMTPSCPPTATEEWHWVKGSMSPTKRAKFKTEPIVTLTPSSPSLHRPRLDGEDSAGESDDAGSVLFPSSLSPIVGGASSGGVVQSSLLSQPSVVKKKPWEEDSDDSEGPTTLSVAAMETKRKPWMEDSDESNSSPESVSYTHLTLPTICSV